LHSFAEYRTHILELIYATQRASGITVEPTVGADLA
jgi:hypothetical protein